MHVFRDSLGRSLKHFDYSRKAKKEYFIFGVCSSHPPIPWRNYYI